MKKIHLLLLAGFTCCYSQKDIDSLKISDLEIPNAPALTLLDKSFSLVEVSNSSNSINANLVNIKDNSVEVVPYWIINKGKFTSSNKYYGFTVDENEVITKQNIFNDFIKKTSFSLAYSTSDELSSISFGLRSNIITVKNITKINKVFAGEKAYVGSRNQFIENGRVAKAMELYNKTLLKSDVKEKIAQLKEETDKNKLRDYLQQLKINSDDEARNALTDQYDKTNTTTFEELTKNFNKHFNHKLFTWDVALGASSDFAGNQSDTGRLGRFGVWSTAKYSFFIGENDFLNLYGYGRFLIDKTQIDETTLDYVSNDYLDIGGKLEFQFNKIAISGEYINRNGDGKDKRLVGIIQYKVMDNLFLSGGYGKNFENENGDLLTLFGLKWGLSQKPTVKFD